MSDLQASRVRPRRPRDITVQLGTRVSVPVRDLLDEVIERGEAASIREAVEQAIMQKWGSAA
ncbi:hypothetical protein GCM10025867_47880 (plasmid) [Frondihabitans sucicola]|uniref:Ribbon-helix-helix protein, CopG family n=1 Tax=Frondihabitans sucicola TaxID=1268041 RepID=A0ABM8GVP6_9MICO|nr:hypothetical protein [Frondihabitans sucicola]BDZ52547.1 hypothetical protein GCM10025867_47880 [Frondihabitans sucicola]